MPYLSQPNPLTNQNGHWTLFSLVCQLYKIHFSFSVDEADGGAAGAAGVDGAV